MRIIFFLNILFVPTIVFSQETDGRIDYKIDEVTYQWDLEADKLATYAGLLSVCANKDYQIQIISLLNDIHHLDSLLYDALIQLSRTSKDNEIKKTLQDIEKFEKGYDTKSFVHFMNKECKAAKKIEIDADDTRNEVGETSYSGQAYILETELYKYVHQITKKIDKIRKHVHHLIIYYE